MKSEQIELSKIYDKLADNLDISPTMAEKAIQSYEAVGKWLGDCDPKYDIRIMPQGSFYLGTVVKHPSDEDKYDIDLVCLLKNGQMLDEYKIKNLVGNRLKEHEKYKSMLDEEGKRCWKLNYDEFHMDILPCVPNQQLFKEPSMTEIKLTHKVIPNYYIAKYSNPYRYHVWFEGRMIDALTALKRKLSILKKVEIDEITTALARTPLQKSIQILKRHRDIMFQGKEEDAPVSIIITTLAAHAYKNETDIFSTLEAILDRMKNYIEIRDGGQYWVPNPAMPLENFAEKWNEEHIKKDIFFLWLEKAKKDILENPLSNIGLDTIANTLKVPLGKNMVEKSINDIADEIKSLGEKDKLYISGLTGGITTTLSEATTKIKRHTFYGR